ncbi:MULTISPECIES: (2Fe-2S) ferredoxin domain-containing protein [Arthrobacter]|uniref:(2Fe-2S) ferredoxin domain-containing protein n=2 Tax=Arthrobacter TaxID=1663 RepID=A0ABU9KP23_9MICC|nr:(2Fe-2S) ferredoxin domain-containing protein [Arthrobacter sp. YJM1]MDP5228656.1 (2Fe-2S) ferredoxin domain-containing protein [Arthrobacter sp. YJM1]
MAKKNGKRAQQKRSDQDQAVVVVCRGGDCGSRHKHPQTDHQGQLRRIRDGVEPAAQVIVSRCLDACDHSNVVVILPDAAGRAEGAGPVWIGEANDADTTQDIIDWVTAGQPAGPGRPALVDIREFTPTRQSRHELDHEAIP